VFVTGASKDSSLLEEAIAVDVALDPRVLEGATWRPESGD
jgi:hypothetical protein